MKKQVLVAGVLLMTAISFGQKKELKKAEKALTSGETTEAMTLLDTAEPMMSGADVKLQTQFYTLRGEAFEKSAGGDLGKLKKSADAYLKALELDPGSTRITDGIQNLRVSLVNSAIQDQNAKKYAVASEKLYTSYMVSKKDTSDLYYAAGNALNGKDYDTAIKYYEILNDLGYTGIKKEYVATDKVTGEVVPFENEKARDLMLRSGNYIKPEEKITESDRSDILRNMTLIYIEKGDEEKAKSLMKTARAENPKDASLVRAEADMVYKMGDMANYSRLMKEVIALDPTNPELYFNLGVSSAELGETEDAIKYYKKALELDPGYTKAQNNIAATILKDEAALVDEMNNLGTSRADNARYDELKDQMHALYNRALPYLEAVQKNDTSKVEVIRTLMNIYSQLGQDDKFKAMKAQLKTIEGN
ncbi:tetratricopeptide repeat protein [Ulvibacter litoralis]|uniref:Tetratricopeptide repeat-containing protein n=1 Tax=Ulvibacter litoralis TaxID=227084 RepID=A0A1G7FRS7_9FLAO|nr:tetratricopeptide repeat protein [Ulvibacter litoralis]SDE78512.1 Tetratricopeptide repeat-containing protein [Ulvibacter litoralis]